jgi:hypothetical protein
VGPPDPRQNIDAAWRSFQFAVRAAALARDAAAQAARVAANHEKLMRPGMSAAEAHQRMAAVQRRNEKCQRAAARMHAAFARNLEMWLARAAGSGDEVPRLMSAVASTSGWQAGVLTLYRHDGAECFVAASDATARRAHELEVALAEGPSWEAAHDGTATTEQGVQMERRWPQFGAAVGNLGVHAVSAAPLDLADHRLWGALTVVGNVAPPASLTRFRLAEVAEALTRTVLRVPAFTPTDGDDLASLEVFAEEDFQPTLHQAAGVLHERCGWPIDDAIALIRAHAYAEERSVSEVAEEVVRGALLQP